MKAFLKFMVAWVVVYALAFGLYGCDEDPFTKDGSGYEINTNGGDVTLLHNTAGEDIEGVDLDDSITVITHAPPVEEEAGEEEAGEEESTE